MFSGIVDAIGRIRRCMDRPGGKTLVVTARDYWRATPPGASIAVDGVCLTLTRADGDDASFDVVTETLQRSTLGDLRPDARVNLQKSLAVGDRIDGHFVQGHVDAVGTVAKVDRSARESKWWFSVQAETMPYLIPKGAVAIDGISLTIVDVLDGRFNVALIPTTLERTTMGRKNIGDRVNIETDVLARTVVSYLESLSGRRKAGDKPAAMEWLERHGFA